MHARLSRGRRRGPVTALVVATVLAVALPASTLGDARFPNPAFEYVTLTPAAAGGTVIALINSGDTFDGVTFEGIPDGLGVVPVGKGDRYVDVYVAFEQSHVPFQGFADFEDSSVQRARLDLKTMQLTKLDEVLPPSAGFIRFCSAFMAGPDEGFAELHVLRERGVGRRHRRAGRGAVRGGSIGHAVPAGGLQRRDRHEDRRLRPRSRSSGDTTTRTRWSFRAAGTRPSSLSGDDTFTAPGSQLYMGTAASPNGARRPMTATCGPSG